MTSTRGKLGSFDGTQIAYQVWGKPDRTPIICCAGIGCNDVYFLPLAQRLQESRQVIIWDYPHHADSGPAGNPDELRIDSLARHGIALADHLKISRTIAAGHSMGVQTALEMYRAARDRVAAMVLIAGPHAHTGGWLYGFPSGGALIPLLVSAHEKDPALFDRIWKFLTEKRLADPVGRLFGLIGAAPVSDMGRYLDHLKQMETGPLLKMLTEGQAHSAEDLLPTITVPTLILHGTADVMTPMKVARYMAETIPGAVLKPIKGGGHTLPIEQPEMICEEIKTFLTQHIDS